MLFHTPLLTGDLFFSFSVEPVSYYNQMVAYRQKSKK